MFKILGFKIFSHFDYEPLGMELNIIIVLMKMKLYVNLEENLNVLFNFSIRKIIVNIINPFGKALFLKKV